MTSCTFSLTCSHFCPFPLLPKELCFPAVRPFLPKECVGPSQRNFSVQRLRRRYRLFCPFPLLPKESRFPAVRLLLPRELSKSLSQLPKVCKFPAFPSHLPKVRKSRIASRRSVVDFVPYMTSSTSEGAGPNGLSPPPSHFRYVPIRIGGGSQRSCQVPCREGDGEKPHPSAPFLQHWIQSASTGLLSGPVPVTQLEGADQSAVSHPPS